MGLSPRRSTNDGLTDGSKATDENTSTTSDIFRRRNLVIAGVAVLVIVAAYCVWLMFQAQSVKSNLEQARTLSQQSKDSLLHEDMSLSLIHI